MRKVMRSNFNPLLLLPWQPHTTTEEWAFFSGLHLNTLLTEAKLSCRWDVIHLTNAMTVKERGPIPLSAFHYSMWVTLCSFFLIIYLSCATAHLVTQNWYYGVCLTPRVTQLAWLFVIQKGSHLSDRGTDCHSILCHILCCVLLCVWLCQSVLPC